MPHNYQSHSPANVVRFTPITVFYGGVGLGLSYERFMDKAQRVSFNLPVYGGLRNYFIGHSGSVGIVESNFSMLVNPGIRLYPRGHSRKLVYAIGPSVFLSHGTDNGYQGSTDPTGNYVEYAEGTETRVGSMINNSFSFNISPRFNVGLEAGVGVSLYTRLKNNTTQIARTGLIAPMALFAFQVGYKF
ncbi:MAG: hypothetical protein EOP54_00325 [Sphingobacteriales bacterium]|nr:MAG: hypothetical protein EOP54_00325 [Sphingobacteriales bacterium]